MNNFKYSNTNKRYHTLDFFYKKKFGCKCSKISINAGFTCPNIDGTVGYGGCIYCSKKGAGENGGNPKDDLVKQFYKIKKIMDQKWPQAKYIGYFQARTNTYASVKVLKEKYEKILNIKDVVGLSISTRPDCINDECLHYLKTLNQKTFLTVELGLQTIHDNTSKLINRCHTLECFENTVKKLKKNNIFTVVHIINGLPYETKEMMIETVKYLNKIDIDGIKIHSLSILKNTPLEEYYRKNKFHILTQDEYVNIVVNQLEYLKPNIVIERLTGDPLKDDLLLPLWSLEKRKTLNKIDIKMQKENIYQGDKII